jgi:hypothetical protein
MLHMYFLQQWYTLADAALKDTLYDSQAIRELIGIDLGREDVPNATTLLKFRRLLEQHDQTAAILAEVKRAPERAWFAYATSHGSGRDHHRSAQLDKERGWQARTRDAPRRRRRVGPDPQRGVHGG